MITIRGKVCRQSIPQYFEHLNIQTITSNHNFYHAVFFFKFSAFVYFFVFFYSGTEHSLWLPESPWSTGDSLLKGIKHGAKMIFFLLFSCANLSADRNIK